jgi:hypothetical protein
VYVAKRQLRSGEAYTQKSREDINGIDDLTCWQKDTSQPPDSEKETLFQESLTPGLKAIGRN